MQTVRFSHTHNLVAGMYVLKICLQMSAFVIVKSHLHMSVKLELDTGLSVAEVLVGMRALPWDLAADRKVA